MFNANLSNISAIMWHINYWKHCQQYLMAIISHGLGVMVFNATFNNISVISWRPVLFIDDRNRSLEKTTALLQVTVKLYIK